MRLPTAASSIVLVIAACATQPSIDVAAEREALMEADRAWAEAYAASDDPVEAFVGQMAEGAVLLPPDAPLAEGVNAIGTAIAGFEDTPGFSVTWGPVDADVGSGGDLGYTRGTYEMGFDGPDGRVTIQGKYLTIWKKQADGTWKVTADMFNADAPMGGAADEA